MEIKYNDLDQINGAPRIITRTTIDLITGQQKVTRYVQLTPELLELMREMIEAAEHDGLMDIDNWWQYVANLFRVKPDVAYTKTNEYFLGNDSACRFDPQKSKTLPPVDDKTIESCRQRWHGMELEGPDR